MIVTARRSTFQDEHMRQDLRLAALHVVCILSLRSKPHNTTIMIRLYTVIQDHLSKRCHLILRQAILNRGRIWKHAKASLLVNSIPIPRISSMTR